MVIVFIEGLLVKMYETSSTTNMYMLGKNYNPDSYILVVETIFNWIRIIIILFWLVCSLKLKIILYTCIIGLIITGLIPFKVSRTKNI